jgi:hypothetical protein
MIGNAFSAEFEKGKVGRLIHLLFPTSLKKPEVLDRRAGEVD